MQTYQDIIEDYSMEFFHALKDELHKWGVNVATEWGGMGFPIVRGYAGPEGHGFYFRREAFGNWEPSELRTLNALFPFIYEGQAVRLVSVMDMDDDGDRYWHASFAMVPYDVALAQADIYERDAEISQSTYNDIAGR